ncbi:hypothetical protein [Gimesia sp.]|uniref:hypothetical protein n=1 Tax=Gimesia sp. TaxID=2024833 RepID=UPI003A90C858
MQNQFSETDVNEITCRTISGQLLEWGIDFSSSRVAQLAPAQIEQLQTWINAGVEADETFQAEFAALPDFMENDLLELKGELASGSREEIIEQAINASEAEVPITDNPYLFDTTGWHLWRKAYCCWHHGESLDFLEEEITQAPCSEQDTAHISVMQKLKVLISDFNQAETELKQLRLKLKQFRQQRNTRRKQLIRFLYQLSTSPEEATTITKSMEPVSSSSSSEQNEAASTPTESSEPINVIRIPVTGPETNRIEVYLQQTGEGTWRAGHFWSVECISQTGQVSRGGTQPGQRQTTFPTDTAALLNETLLLSRKLGHLPEIQTQIIDYLNLLEEFPGQLDLCSNCHQHWLSEDLDLSGSCPECSAD